jgi:dihydroorotate dehydrogenase electron transfer subunit
MLKAVWNAAKTPGISALRERMGCGFGACMGCTCKTKNGTSVFARRAGTGK